MMPRNRSGDELGVTGRFGTFLRSSHKRGSALKKSNSDRVDARRHVLKVGFFPSGASNGD
jgi:hypothetical protein